MRPEKHSVPRAISFGALGVAALVVAASLVAAQAPSGELLVVLTGEKGGPALGFVDLAAGRIVARVPVQQDPHIVRMSADGKLAFVNNRNSIRKRIPERDGISIIDVTARKLVRHAETGDGSRPHDLQVVGDKVYFTATGYKALGRYDLTRNKVEYFGTGQSGPTQIVVSKDGDTVIGVNPGSNNISMITNILAGWPGQLPDKHPDPVTSATLWRHTLIPAGDAPSGIAISPDGREAWTANEDVGGGISIVNIAKRTAQTLDLKTQHVVRLQFTKDGRQVLLIDRDTGGMTVIDAASRKVIKRLTFPGEKPNQPMTNGNLTVDASHAYVTVSPSKGGSEGDYYIAVIDLKTLEVIKRIPTVIYANGMTCARCS